ncbi:MAG: hypothetical protein DRJ03_03570 [Chloroflexi bacterium]|nr:MAG: hypothetical protein DRJ03_03570 [Chloroflexota bacterium]
MGEENKENTVVINEPEPEAKDNPMTEESLVEEGVGADQIALAKKHGMLDKSEDNENKNDDDNKEIVDDESEDDDSEDESEEEESEEIKADDLDSFDKVHNLFENEPEKFRQLPKNIRGLYHNSKGLYKRLKSEEQKRQDTDKKADLLGVKVTGSLTKIAKIRERLKNNPDDVTIEQILEIVGDEESQPEFVTKEDLVKEKEAKATEEANQKALTNRLEEANKWGEANVENFETIIDQAQEVVNEDKTYLELIQSVLLAKEFDEQKFVNTVIKIAKLNPNYGKKKSDDEEESDKDKSGKESKDNINRMLKNAKKKTSSAAVGGGKGRRVVSYDDLTPEDVVNMSQKEWNALPNHVRTRLKGGA